MRTLRWFVWLALSILMLLGVVCSLWWGKSDTAVTLFAGTGPVVATKASMLPKLIATYRDVPPDMLMYSIGRHSGPLRYVVEEAAERIGYAIQWQPLPFSESMEQAGKGSVDIIPYAHFKTPEREKILRFSVSLGRVPAVSSFLLHANDPRAVKTLEDLRGRTVGYRPGSYYFDEFATDTDFTKVPYPDDKKLVKGFIDNSVEVIIVNNRKAAERALAAAGYNANDYRYADLSVEREADLYLMYSRHAQHQAVFDRLDLALEQMKSEGLIAEIYKSFDADPPKGK